MRLLNTTTLVFKEFFDEQIPRYTILSHRWSEIEASYQEFQTAIKENDFTDEKYRKVLKCCSLSVESGYEWTWIDTCCINKESSAEMTEAINSMYEWYRRADMCYAYLFDVLWDSEIVPHINSAAVGILTPEARLVKKAWAVTSQSEFPDFTEERESPECSGSSRESFRASQWFTRGWTLQELLAPKHLFFYDSSWRPIGQKTDVAQDIAAVTRIDREYLSQASDPVEASVAKKMSWASRRETSRLEDTAYCLLGLFDVNMPLLYGEGRKAFIRLQLEIIKKEDDETIFAWCSKNMYWQGLLAPWPSAFECSHGVERLSRLPGDRLPYAMTNKGLQFRLSMSRQEWERAKGNNGERGQFLLTLVNCFARERLSAPAQHIDIRLQEAARPVPYRGVDYWERADSTRLDLHPVEWGITEHRATRDSEILDESKTTIIYIRQYGL